MCEKLYERSRLHRGRSEKLFEQMSSAAPLPRGVAEPFSAVWSSMDLEQKRKYGWLSERGLHSFWLLIHLGSVVFGFVMSATIAHTACGQRGLGLFLAAAAPLAAVLVSYAWRAIRAKRQMTVS